MTIKGKENKTEDWIKLLKSLVYLLNYRRGLLEELLRDGISLLERILNHNPDKNYIEVYIRLSSTELSYNKWLGSQLFGYQDPKTPIRLMRYGVFEKIEKITNVYPRRMDFTEVANVAAEAIDYSEELINSDLYEGRVVEENPVVVNVPGLSKIEPKGLRGLYKIKVSRFTAQNWLNKNTGRVVPTQKPEGKFAPASTPSKRELRKKISNIIKNGKFGKKERDFLKFLSKDFEPKTIEEIKTEVSTKAPTKLKAIVQKKLKGTGFYIETDRGSGWGRKSTYQLKYLPSPENP